MFERISVFRSIYYHLHFFRIPKSLEHLTSRISGANSEKAMQVSVYIYIFGDFFVFHEKMCFYHWHFFSRLSIKFSKQNINHSESGISHKKLPVESKSF